ncbi:MAG TPA: hypothetical protein PJ982_18365, partial [Lacipirellulaceae bacterium]|nr:hypothetical protein [Lacipirellulaceae bacterium]
RLSPDRTELSATGDDLCYALVEAVDADGVLCPLADHEVAYEIEGPADLAGVGNGNPLSYESFQSDRGRLFFGKAMLIVRTRPRAAGEIRITARSEGLDAATAACTAHDP